MTMFAVTCPRCGEEIHLLRRVVWSVAFGDQVSVAEKECLWGHEQEGRCTGDQSRDNENEGER